MHEATKEHQNHNHKHHYESSNQKVMTGSSQEIAFQMAENNNKLIVPGSHNLLIYNDLKKFREIYSQGTRAWLAENEIVVIATQYDPIEEVKNTLRLAGVDIERHLSQGSLFILDAQQGY
jgi:hypothetical protein